LWLTVVSLVLTFTFAHTVWAEGKKTKKPTGESKFGPASTVAVGVGCGGVSVTKSSDKQVCKVYSLAELGEDPNLCKWVAETIPDVIQPGTWNKEASGDSKQRVLTYYAPSKILVVYHTPEVQTRVEAFLSNLKKAMPQEKQGHAHKHWTNDSGFVPAKYSTPNSIKYVEPAPSKCVEPATLPAASSYPVPNQCKQPKHLFHFIIRYEGEGIVDDTVSSLLKDVYGKDKDKDKEEDNKSKEDDSKPEGKPENKTTTNSAGYSQSGESSKPARKSDSKSKGVPVYATPNAPAQPPTPPQVSKARP